MVARKTMVEDRGWWRTEGGCKEDDGGGQRVVARKTMVEDRGWLQGRRW